MSIARDPARCLPLGGAPMRVRPDDQAYQAQARLEAEYWAHPVFTTADLEAEHPGAVQRFVNRSYTGNPDTTWLEDTIARGPFGRAAVLGCAEGRLESGWLRRQASRRLDIYDLSDGAMAKAREHLKTRRFGFAWPDRRARFIRADLNFIRLPRDRYDVIWSTASLHHVINLEYVMGEIDAALRNGGLFALHDYVGEAHLQYHPQRLRLVNDALQEVPRRFRKAGMEEVRPPLEAEMSPFEAVRSDEILDIARARFEVVHLALTHALFPLFMLLDFTAMEREAPDVLHAVLAAEERARHDPAVRRCSVYAVFRQRGR